MVLFSCNGMHVDGMILLEEMFPPIWEGGTPLKVVFANCSIYNLPNELEHLLSKVFFPFVWYEALTLILHL